MLLSKAFVLISEMATNLGVRSIKDLPGCWEYSFGDGWRVAVNGHKTETYPSWNDANPPPPYHALVEKDGWPYAILSPHDGTFLAGTEDLLINALTAQLPVQEAGRDE